MNILFISNDPQLARKESAVRARMRAYAAALAELHPGSELHILFRGSVTKSVQEANLFIHAVRMNKLRMFWKLHLHARKLIAAHHIAVVSAQDPFEHGLIALRAVRDTPVKLHLQIHTDFLTPWFTKGHIYRSPRVRMPLLNRVRRRLAAHVLPHAAGIRAVSKRVADSLQNTYGSRVVVPTIIPVSVSTEVPAAVPLPEHPFTFAILSVGRLEPEKRIEDVIAAVYRLKNEYPFLGAIIANEGRELPKLQRMARRLGLTDRILFIGKRDDIRGLMRSAQAFIQTSAYEGYGLALVEAALARVPIVTSDVGIVGEVFKGYEHVLAAPVADPTNFAAHIAWLIEDNEARRELAIHAEARAREHLASIDTSPRAIIADVLRSAQDSHV